VRQRPQDLFLVREAPFGVLREDHLTVEQDVELTRGPCDQGGLDAALLLDGRRETRSARTVVSDVAVLDDDRLHATNMGLPVLGGKGWRSAKLPGERRTWHPRGMSSREARGRSLDGVGVVLALALALVGPAACGSGGASGAGGASTSSTGASPSDAGADDAATLAACEACVATECQAESAACTADCFGIQACIDAICFNLSATSAPTEGDCQVYCQSLHSAGRAAHLAWVECATTQAPSPDGGGSCLPPCHGAPSDYDTCAAAATAGTCASAAAACSASKDCTSYVSCAAACTSATECLACAQSSTGAAGEPYYEALQLCVAQECLALEWLPHY
jgi:hypothetical protein